MNQLRRQERPLLVTFHCGIYFVYYAVFMMSVGRSDLEEYFNQMGPNFIRDMIIIMSFNTVGYIALWNMRRMAILILLVGGIAFCWYGFHIGYPILPNYLPLLACLTSAPMWPVLKTP